VSRPGGHFLVAVLAAVMLAFSGLGQGILRHGDEARFALAGRELLRGGPWLVPTTLGEPLVIKPPLFIWLVALAGRARGQVDELAARLPGALAAVVTVAALFLLGRRLFGPRVALSAALLLSTTVGWFLLAREVLPDMAMTAASTGAVLAAVAAAQDGTRRAAVGFAAALALAFHFKLLAGLIPPAAAVILVAALRRDLASIRALRPALGTAVFLLLLLPWLVRYLLVPDFMLQIDAETFGGRTWNSWRSVYTSPLRTLQVLGETLFPWTLLVPAAIGHLWRRRRRLREDPLLVPLAWLFVVIAMNAAVHTVRWRYVLPALPPASLVLAAIWHEHVRREPVEDGRGQAERRLLVGPLAGLSALFALVGSVVLVRPDLSGLVAGDLPERFRALPWILVAGVWIAGGAGGLWLIMRRPRLALPVCVALAGLGLVTLDPLTREGRDRGVDPRPFAAEVRAAAAGRTIGFNGGSGLVSSFHFYLDAPEVLVRDADLAAVLARPTGELIILPVATLEALRRQGAVSPALTALAEGRFDHYHLVLVQSGGGARP
jgi:4-amino-4-deoxy-L-arabinose transferase-like glycosyltransferase